MKTPSDHTRRTAKQLLSALDRALVALEEVKRLREALKRSANQPPLRIHKGRKRGPIAGEPGQGV